MIYGGGSIKKYGLDKFVKFAKNVWNIDDTNKSKEEVAIEGLNAMEAWMNELGLIMNITELGATKEMAEDLVNATIILEGGYKFLNKEEIKEIFIKSL